MVRISWTGSTSVVLDNYSGGYNVIKHLFRLGHDRIAVLTGILKALTGIERTEGVRQALKDFGLGVDPRLILECQHSREKAYAATLRLLKTKRPPTAIFAQDDDMAIGVREAVLKQGMGIPEDIALVGFDDIEVGALRASI